MDTQSAAKLVKAYRINNAKDFRLRQIDPNDTAKIKSKQQAAELLGQGVSQLAELQEKLYAQNCWALLLIFQAMDAAGKDSTIKHVMSGVNPQGVQVYSFKAPSDEELDHDFLWRAAVRLPERGRIGVFNRSHLRRGSRCAGSSGISRAPAPSGGIDRQEHLGAAAVDINAFERYLTRNGVVIRKFFLHVSKEEQLQRFLARLDEPEKNWKFAPADVQERERWDEYMEAYEQMIRHTSTDHAPWHVVPADHKWFTRLVVSATVVETLQSLKLKLPEISPARLQELEAARRMLRKQKEKS